LITPQECKQDIERMQHFAIEHGAPGVFVCVATRPRIEHPRRWQRFEEEIERKSLDWGCKIEMPLPWLAVLWKGQD
jgi:hypothetical protein